MIIVAIVNASSNFFPYKAIHASLINIALMCGFTSSAHFRYLLPVTKIRISSYLADSSISVLAVGISNVTQLEISLGSAASSTLSSYYVDRSMSNESSSNVRIPTSS